MSLGYETVSENRSFGGTQGVYKHRSEATGTDMTFGLYLPPEALRVLIQTEPEEPDEDAVSMAAAEAARTSSGTRPNVSARAYVAWVSGVSKPSSLRNSQRHASATCRGCTGSRGLASTTLGAGIRSSPGR